MSTLLESLGAIVNVSVGESVGRSVLAMPVVGLPVGASVVNSVELGAALGLPAPESIVGVSVTTEEGPSERVAVVGVVVKRDAFEVEVEVGAALGLPAPDIVGVSVDTEEGSSERVAVVGVVRDAVEVEDGMAVTSEDGAGVEVGRIEGMVERTLEGFIVGPVVGAMVGIELGEAAVRIISTRT